MTEKKIRVAVIFGGRSGEHEVSLASAQSVMDAMDPDKYEIHQVGITKEGRWISAGEPMKLLSEADPSLYLPDETAAEAAADGQSAGQPPAVAGGRELVPGTSGVRFPEVDVVFPVLHGNLRRGRHHPGGCWRWPTWLTWGRGCWGQAWAMDKIAMKAAFATAGLPVVDYLPVLRSHWRSRPDEIVAQVEARFEYPVFLKPANLGSSVGVSKAHNRDELVRGLDLAARFDRRLMVEAAVEGPRDRVQCAGQRRPDRLGAGRSGAPVTSSMTIRPSMWNRIQSCTSRRGCRQR